MTEEVRYLADTSAIVKLADPAWIAELGPLIQAGQVATCGVVDLELYALVRDPAELGEIRAVRAAAFPWLETRDEDLKRALEAQATMLECGEAVPWARLVVAAVAERCGVTLVDGKPLPLIRRRT